MSRSSTEGFGTLGTIFVILLATLFFVVVQVFSVQAEALAGDEDQVIILNP